MSSSLDPDQARHFVGPELGSHCLQSFQQARLAGIELISSLWRAHGDNYVSWSRYLAMLHVREAQLFVS